MRYLWILVATAASLAVTDIQGRIESADSTVCSCLRSAIKFLSFFPCINGSEIRGSPGECDIFAYPAALLAAEHINRNPSILKFPELGFNTSLKLVEIGTMNDVAFSSFSLAEYFRNHQPGSVQGIIGPSSSAITEKIGYIAGNKYRLYQISYGATDLSLSNRDRYPLLFRTATSEESLNVGRLKLLDMMGWTKSGLVSSKSRVAEHFATLAAKDYRNIDVAYFGSFVQTPMFAFDEIRRSDLRIIVGIFEEEHARNVLCLASRYPHGSLADANHVWILPSYYNPNWWNITERELRKRPTQWQCSNQEMKDILESVLFVGAFNYHPAESTTSGLTLSEFYSQLMRKTLQVFPSFAGEDLVPYLPHSSAPTAYDAVWSLALTWNDTILELFSNTDVCDLRNSSEVQTIIAETLKLSVENFTLKGISGIHHFNQSLSLLQAHHGQIIISQFFQDGLSHPIGFYDLDFMAAEDSSEFMYLSDLDHVDEVLGNFTADSFRWKDQPNNMPPTDGVEVSLSSISVAALCFTSVLLLTAILFATALLVINVTMRTNKHIKASSPRLNMLIIIGLMLVMPSCLMVGLTFSRYAYDIPLVSANWMCQLNIWLTCVGYVLTFATMIAKNWRVYRIFYNKQLQRRHSISDNKLLLLVLFLVLPILVVLITWVAVDPLHWQETSIVGLNTKLNISYCSCEHYTTWNGINISYVLFLLISLMAIIIQNLRKASMIKDVRVAARFVEEGNSNARATLISLFIFMALSVTTLLLELRPEMYVATFWAKVVWLLILPVILLLVIYLPKFGAMYLDRIEERYLQEQHQYFCAIREEMAKQDVILRRNRKRAQPRPKSLTELLLRRCRSLVVEYAFGTKHDDEGSDENGDSYNAEILENTGTEMEFQLQDNADGVHRQKRLSSTSKES